jgi:hypothetical protein
VEATRQIICIRKQQHTNHMEDDIKRILQDKQFHLQFKSEQKEIIQNVLERNDSMAMLPTGFGENMNSGPAHFHVSWLSDFIFYPKPLYKSLHQSFFYSFITILQVKQKAVGR